MEKKKYLHWNNDKKHYNLFLIIKNYQKFIFP